MRDHSPWRYGGLDIERPPGGLYQMKHRLPLFVAGTATVLASFGAVAQSASATPVPERGQTWLSVPVAQGQTWLSPTASANKWFSPLAGHSFLGGLIHLPGNYGTGPVMPPLF